jgi:hypothetical protein
MTDEVERLFAKHAAMRPENVAVAEAVEYALATPIDVQVHTKSLEEETSFA